MMPISNRTYTQPAFNAIQEYLKTGKTVFTEKEEIPDELLIKRSCFVTLKNKKGKLMGCIGTIKPSYKNLYYEIIRNAVSSAINDSRFSRIKLKDLDNLIINVEVLFEPEEINNLSLLDPKIYGLIISDNFHRRGVLLPGIAEIDTIEKQIRIVKKKAGINQETNSDLKFYRFKTEKYY